LLYHSAHADVQGDKITTLTSAAKVEVEPIWASLLAKALDGKDVKDLLTNVGGGGAPAAGAPAAAAGGDAAPAEAAKEEKKEEAKEESDDDMVSLFVPQVGRISADLIRASVSSTNRLAKFDFWTTLWLLRMYRTLYACRSAFYFYCCIFRSLLCFRTF
jgi:large subunit ribosomal protein LP1